MALAKDGKGNYGDAYLPTAEEITAGAEEIKRRRLEHMRASTAVPHQEPYEGRLVKRLNLRGGHWADI